MGACWCAIELLECNYLHAVLPVDLMRNSHFDLRGFFASVDVARRSRRLTWKQVASETGVSASSLSRMSAGRRPDVDTLAALTAWAELDLNQFISASRKSNAKFAPGAVAAYLSQDPNLSSEAVAALTEVLAVSYDRLTGSQGTIRRRSH